jgi:cell division protein ZapA
MPELTRVETRIYDNDYVITGEASEDYINRVSGYVDSRMKELSRAFPEASSTKLAILTAVNIADEFFQLKENPSKESSPTVELEERARKLIVLLDKSLIGE